MKSRDIMKEIKNGGAMNASQENHISTTMIAENAAIFSNFIYCLSDSNGIRTHNHLVCKRTLNHLAKLTIRTKWLGVQVQLQSLIFQISHLF